MKIGNDKKSHEFLYSEEIIIHFAHSADTGIELGRGSPHEIDIYRSVMNSKAVAYPYAG